MFSQESFKKKGSFLIPMDQDRRTGFVFLFVSVVVHGLFFGGLNFFQDFHFSRSMPSVIQIDLVSFSPIAGSDQPGGGGGITKEDTKGVKTESQEAKETGALAQPAEIQKDEPPPVVKADISLKAKPKNLKELLAEQEKKAKEEEKKKEEKTNKKTPQKEITNTKISDKSNETHEKNNLSDVLGRLRKKVAEQGKQRQGEGEGSEGEGKGTGKGGGSGGVGKGGSSPIDIYNYELGTRIRENWVFNDSLARMDRNLEVRILIKILKSGEIRDIIFETRSGNSYLDES
ncbi:MAG: hypothetical protein A3J80_04040, partial [Desulfobacula sp. RIFOXYB2_FULL_45_6]